MVGRVAGVVAASVAVGWSEAGTIEAGCSFDSLLSSLCLLHDHGTPWPRGCFRFLCPCPGNLATPAVPLRPLGTLKVVIEVRSGTSISSEVEGFGLCMGRSCIGPSTESVSAVPGA